MMPELIDMSYAEMHEACEVLSQYVRRVPLTLPTTPTEELLV